MGKSPNAKEGKTQGVITPDEALNQWLIDMENEGRKEEEGKPQKGDDEDGRKISILPGTMKKKRKFNKIPGEKKKRNWSIPQKERGKKKMRKKRNRATELLCTGNPTR